MIEVDSCFVTELSAVSGTVVEKEGWSIVETGTAAMKEAVISTAVAAGIETRVGEEVGTGMFA